MKKIICTLCSLCLLMPGPSIAQSEDEAVEIPASEIDWAADEGPETYSTLSVPRPYYRPHLANSYLYAHRGVFAGTYAVENTVDAVALAHGLRFPGVELDVRLSQDDVPFVIHDKALNRSVNDCDYVLQSFLKEWNKCENRIHWVSNSPSSYLKGLHFVKHDATGNHQTNAYLKSLWDALTEIQERAFTGGLTLRPNFRIILDVQDPLTAVKTAEKVRNHPMREYVVIKFFASAAINSGATWTGTASQSDNANYIRQIAYWGRDLKYIVQVNSGQFGSRGTATTRNTGYVTSFGVSEPLQDVVDKWLSVNNTYPGAIVGVAASIMPNRANSANTYATRQMMRSVRGRTTTYGILINPDVMRRLRGSCQGFRFDGTKVSLTPFSITDEGERIKRNFAMEQERAIADVAYNSDAGPDRVSSRWEDYLSLC